jgi:hypothetical protein
MKRLKLQINELPLKNGGAVHQQASGTELVTKVLLHTTRKLYSVNIRTYFHIC